MVAIYFFVCRSNCVFSPFFRSLPLSGKSSTCVLCFVYLFWSKLGNERQPHYQIIQKEPKINRSEKFLWALVVDEPKKKKYIPYFIWVSLLSNCIFVQFPGRHVSFLGSSGFKQNERESKGEKKVVCVNRNKVFLLKGFIHCWNFNICANVKISLENVVLMEFLGWAAFDLTKTNGQKREKKWAKETLFTLHFPLKADTILQKMC